MSSVSERIENGRRFYTYKGTDYPSVTTVLGVLPKRGLQAWKKKMKAQGKDPEVIRNNAATTGKALHYRVGVDLAVAAGITPPVFDLDEPVPEAREEDYELMVTYWTTMQGCCRPEARAVEQFLWHPSGYAGRADIVCRFDWDFDMMRDNFRFGGLRPTGDELWLCDIKTGGFVAPSWGAQLFAYKQAWDWLHPNEQIDRTAIWQITGDGWAFIECCDQRLWETALGQARFKGLVK